MTRTGTSTTTTTPTGTAPTGAWPPEPPRPPLPPERPPLPHTPWQPDPRPAGPGSASAFAAVVVEGDWLQERLLDQRILALAGELDPEAVNRAVAALALLDASSDDPVRLRLSGVRADLDATLTLVDAIDLVGAPVHATCLGSLAGPAVALLAVADVRTVGPHAVLQLTEPRAPRGLSGREVETAAAQRARQLRRLQERLAAACGRGVEEIAADMRAGRLLGADDARAYGLADGPA
jgi:ATP-dependent Clp protease protease subunit